MAVAGRKPIEDRAQARNRMPQAEGTEWVEVVNLPFAAGPPLPSREDPEFGEGKPPALMGQERRWPKSTERWWQAISSMPHCVLWGPTDWEYAIATAESHARFIEGWKGCQTGAELRMRERRLGITHDDRRDLRIRYVKPPDPDAPLPANVTRGNFGEL